MSRETDFPNLSPDGWRQFSQPDQRYNCVAFAAGRTDVYWWPDPFPDPFNDYWPPGLPREETIDAIAELYISLGYEPCADAASGPGYEKVALYANGIDPTHAARQLPDGRWLSKLGPQEDIEHGSFDDLTGPSYGQVARILKRPVVGTVPRAG